MANNYTDRNVELLKLTKQIVALELNPNKTPQESVTLNELVASYNAISDKPITSAPVATEPGYATVNDISTNKSVASSVIPTGTSVQYGKHEDSLVKYINATPHLNPWGRMRQCDDDLKNLAILIDKDLGYEVQEWTEVISILKDITKP